MTAEGVDLATVVRIAWRAFDDGARSDAEVVRWRDLRFVGTYGGRTVEGRKSNPPSEWTRAVLRELRAGTLDRQCLPVIYRGDSWQGVNPARIDWTGYRHAGGDAARRSRSGPSGPTTPESERDRVQVKLSLGEGDARDLRELAQRRGVTVSALVAELVRDAG